MANKTDVLNAFYEGGCTALAADHQRTLAGGALDVDTAEFSAWLDTHPEYEEFRVYCE